MKYGLMALFLLMSVSAWSLGDNTKPWKRVCEAYPVDHPDVVFESCEACLRENSPCVNYCYNPLYVCAATGRDRNGTYRIYEDKSKESLEEAKEKALRGCSSRAYSNCMIERCETREQHPGVNACK